MAGEVTQASGEKVSTKIAAAHHARPFPQQPIMLGMVGAHTALAPLYPGESLGTL